MITRREVIGSGLAVSMLARTSVASVSSADSQANWLPVPYFVADERFGAAHEASHAAAGSGAAIMTFPGDVTALYESLDLAWRSARFAVSGMTTTAALFVLERLAWERGLRTAYRGVHRPTSEGSMRHELAGSSELLRRLAGEHDSHWASRVGRELAWWSPAKASGGEATLLSQMLPCAHRATLVSWLLTPKDDRARTARK
ncbi:MAG TPA: hypothetical protein VIM81_00845 [Gammaproteobacteria bacterium]